MMKKRPLTIKLLAWALFLSPLGITAELIYLYRIPLEYWHAVFQPEIWHWQIVAAMVISPLAGIAAWSVHPWGYRVLVAYACLIMANNLVLWAANLSQSSFGLRIVLLAGVLTFFVLLIRKEFMAPYFNPRLRWWEQARRYEAGNFRMAVREYGSGTLLFESATLDISLTGCYLLTDHEVSIGQNFCLDVVLPNGNTHKATGEVVWVHRNDNHPKGFGCRFVAKDPHFRRELHKALISLHLHLKRT